MGNAINVGPSDMSNMRDYGTITSIIVPDSLDGRKVTAISGYAFLGCTNLTSITIPEGVTRIGRDTFKGCTSLMSINIPEGVTDIGNGAFFNCTSLTSIIIKDGLTVIDMDTFRNCTSLMSINIPKGVTSIETRAFEGCTSITSITIPEGVTRIGSYAFDDCKSLKSITIPEGLIEIDNGTFYDCESLTSISIPNSIISIAKMQMYWGIEDPFYGCVNLTTIYANSGSYASTYNWKYGTVNTNIGYTAGTLIIDTKNNAKAKLLEANNALVKYTDAGGMETDTLYKNIKTAIGAYSTAELIEKEIDMNKLKLWISGLDRQIEELDFAIISFKADCISPQIVGQAIKLSTNSIGGTGTLETKYAVYDGKKWTVIKNFSTVGTVVWKPNKAGNYKISVTVKDGTGKKVSKSINYVINNQLEINELTANLVSPQKVGTGITLLTKSSGGIGTLQTKYAVYDGKKWTVIKDFSIVGTVVWKPTKSGSYKISVSVKDETGKKVSKSITYVIK